MRYSINIYLLKIPKNLFENLWIIVLINVCTTKHILAQLNSNNSPIDGILLATSIKPNYELVDQIESIDVTSNQLVITTSKVGPPESMKLSIQVVDIQSGLELPSINITGILLILTRGRYTINFLSPSHWYGIIFRCEQQYGGILGPVYVNEEKHLVKTQKEDGPNLDNQPIMTIFTKRNGKGGKTLENLLVTMKWEVHPDERSNIDVVANITLYCKEQIKFKQLHLFGREVEKSVEVKLDNHFELMEIFNKTRQITASITPKNCPRICWNAELIAETARGFHFQRNAAQKCEDIAPVIVTTTLRNYLSYEANSTNLILHTNYTNPSEEEASNREADAYIQISAIPIPEPTKQENITNRFKIFRTNNEENDFTIDHLEPNRLYAVQYTYGKQSPFAYAESRRFVVETEGSSNSNQQSYSPVELDFEPIGYDSEKLTNNSALYNKNFNNSGKITIRLNPKFEKYEIGIDVDPFCDPTTNNGSHFWLTKDKPSRDLKNFSIIEIICNNKEIQENHQSLCDGQSKKNCLLSPEICYTANILLEEKIYSMERKCVDLIKNYPIKAAPLIKPQKDNLMKPVKESSANSNFIFLHSFFSLLFFILINF